MKIKLRKDLKGLQKTWKKGKKKKISQKELFKKLKRIITKRILEN